MCVNAQLSRNKPGRRLVAINVASIAIVADPHIGLTKVECLSHLVANIVAAAKASSKGALPGIFLYPCLASVSPDVSINISAVSFLQNRCITAASNDDPEFGLPPVLFRILSAIASFTFTFAYNELFILGCVTLLVTEK